MKSFQMSMLRKFAEPVVFMMLFCALAHAHLGEEHPPGQHAYFPDPPISAVTLGVEAIPHTTGSWWTDAHGIPGRTDEMMISSRFQSMRLVLEDSKREYLRTGEDYRYVVEGMPAFEFHPGFDDPMSPGYQKFYTLTSEIDSEATPDFVSGTGVALHNVLHEWTVSDLTANTFEGSKRELLRFQQSDRFHNVNDLEFASDNTLFITVGEDQVEENSPDLSSVFGKLLRIDPLGNNSANGRYGIPIDNPYVNDPNAAAEVYASGLRNPWRVSVDNETDDVWVFDVGWASIEEVNKIVPGGNYGWPTKEGSLIAGREALPDEPDPETGLTLGESMGLIDPVFEYDHLQGVSIAGGFVYRGSEFPWLQGKVIFGNLGIGSLTTPSPRVFYGDPDTGEFFELVSQASVDTVWGKTCNYRDETVSCPIYSINEDENGEILLLGKSVMRVIAKHDDFNRDGAIGVADIDALTRSVAGNSEDPEYDANYDGAVDQKDVIYWVEEVKQSYVGDSNLDGVFDSDDLIEVFRKGEYEDGLVMNSAWSSGDWNADGEFSSEDLVFAIAYGKYERSEAVAVVPEPSAASLLSFAVLLLGSFFRPRK